MNRGAGAGHESHGLIAWMVRSGIAANLLLLFIVTAGLVSLTGLVQEAFPEISLDLLEVSVSYPGAAPGEVEEAIVVRIEEQVDGIDDVQEITSVATQGLASVTIELKSGADIDRALADVESAVDRIRTFPAQAERPEVKEVTSSQSALRLVLHGDVSERALKELAYRTEDAIAALPEVSRVETSGVRDYEISIEVPLQRLHALGLTLEDVSNAVRRGSLDLSAGRIETRDAQIRVRTAGQRYDQQDFEALVVLSRSDGAVVRLGDVAEVRDGFQAADLIVRYQGRPAAFVEVFRAANEHLLDVTRAVKELLDRQLRASLPPGTGIGIWNDDSEAYRERLEVLRKNGFLGLLLVLLSLALFLGLRLAFWVALGMVVAGVGALAVMLATGTSLNAMSLFAFLLATGIVVDDAIVVAEGIHQERARGAPGAPAAIRGAQRVARPLIFAVLTSVAAFSPLLFVPGAIGDLMHPVPVILIAVLLLSLVESLLILPSHLSHLPGPEWRPSHLVERAFLRLQSSVDRGLRWFVEGPLDRGLRVATGHPAVLIAAGLGVTVLGVALVPAGIVNLAFGQGVAGDVVTANLRMREGTTARRTHEAARELEAAGRRAIDRLSRGLPERAPPLRSDVILTVGLRPRMAEGAILAPGLVPPANLADVQFKLSIGQRRDIRADAFLEAWREEAGVLPEARALTFSAAVLDFGVPIEIALSHPDTSRLDRIADQVVAELGELQGVFGVQSDHSAGVQEIRLALRPEARTLGLTLDDLARQARSAFFGDEALRLQRGREEVRVYVRLPAGERDAVADVERYLVRTPGGATVPLSRVASVSLGSSPSSIRRRGGRRVVTVTAQVDETAVTGTEVNGVLAGAILPALAGANPGFTWLLGGERQQQTEFLSGLGRSLLLALFAIYALLAIPLDSYLKPLIVMSAIPFGMVGAIVGHLILGIDLGFTSILGAVAVCGVVVNDSLVMIDFIHERLRDGAPVKTAIVDGAKGRFRPIFLTSLTTFLGFMPLLLESAVQARLLVPFAASMGFGIAIASAILMLVVPAFVAVYFQIAPPRGSVATAHPVTTG